MAIIVVTMKFYQKISYEVYGLNVTTIVATIRFYQDIPYNMGKKAPQILLRYRDHFVWLTSFLDLEIITNINRYYFFKSFSSEELKHLLDLYCYDSPEEKCRT